MVLSERGGLRAPERAGFYRTRTEGSRPVVAISNKSGGVPQAVLQGMGLPSLEIPDRVTIGNRGVLQKEGRGNRVFFFSGLEAQGEINRLLDRLFGGYDD
jgi:hypothetical protein